MRRSIMFLPAAKPGNLLNADVYGADGIVIDLEDATAIGEKDSARILLKHALRTFHYNAEVIIRINSLSTPWWKADLEMIVPEKPDTIMPTKVYTPNDIRLIDETITRIETEHGMEVGKIRLLPLLETAGGIEHAYEIALASPRIDGLYLGAVDLALDMKATLTDESYEIAYARSRLVTAARTVGIDAIDTPYLQVRNYEGLQKVTRIVKNMGFNGKACIYPGQVSYVNAIFSPTAEEYEIAKAVVSAFNQAESEGRGVVVVGGKMYDGPAITIVRNTVEEYERINGVRT